MRDVVARQHRGRRHRVGRRDDGTEHEGHRPGNLRHQELEHRAHRQRGDDHQADGEEADRPPVRFEVTPGREQRRLVQDRRQHQHQEELRVERGVRQSRHEAEQAAAGDQRDRVGQVHAPRQPAERERAQQEEQQHLQERHAAA